MYIVHVKLQYNVYTNNAVFFFTHCTHYLLRTFFFLDRAIFFLGTKQCEVNRSLVSRTGVIGLAVKAYTLHLVYR